MKKKIFAIAMMFVLAFTMVACGVNADTAGDLVQAELDSQLKQQHDKLAELTNETVDTIKATYENDLADLMDELSTTLRSAGMNITDEQVESIKDSYLKVYSYADYSIDGSEKDGDTFVVTVNYKTVNNFMNLDTIMNEKAEALNEEEIANMSLEEQINLSLQLYVDAYSEAAASAEYGEEGTATVRVSKEDNLYVCSLSDLQSLVSKMIPEPY